MPHRTRPHAISLDRMDVQILTGFARGYLHEDFVTEYGDAAGAARAFAADASPHERQVLADALDRLADESADKPPLGLTHFVASELRCAWRPTSTADVRVLASAVRYAPR